MGMHPNLTDKNFRRRETIPTGLPLPFPFTDDVVAVALKELPEATRRATEACIKCYKVRVMTDSVV